MTFSLGSLFAGIGGFDLGFERAGFRTAWQAEIDPAAQGVLRRRFPGAKLCGDVRGLSGLELEPVDVVTFGSPCQDLSRGGKQAGLAGERSGLFHEAIRIIRELRGLGGGPGFVVWENVPGALSSNGGDDFAAVLESLVDVGANDVAWRVVDAVGFGVPARRRRLFVVGDFGADRAAEVLRLAEGGEGNPSPSRGERRKGSVAAARGASHDGRWWSGADVADCLDLSMLTKGQMMPEKRRFPCVYEPDDGWRKVVFSADCDDEGGCPACGVDFGDCSCFGPTMDGVEYDERADGLFARAEARRPGAERLRRLTPIEVERCFGFPDGWTESRVDEAGTSKNQSDVARFRQLGNSIAVPVSHWIATGIATAMQATR